MYIFDIQVVSMQTSTPHTHLRTPLRHLLVVARKGQITIPAPIRDALHIKEGDTVAVELQGEEVKITPVPSTLAAGYQSIPALAKPLSWKEIEEIVKDERAEAAAREG
jgi:AbrB family looped-hinge helix DNA binding protein